MFSTVSKQAAMGVSLKTFVFYRLLTCDIALHFKLAIANEKAAESYDDAQCVYVPQLDPSRDKTMTDLLPDYLVDEITFPRPQAAKFYARVVKALTEKGN